jgi:hypothetical protein
MSKRGEAKGDPLDNPDFVIHAFDKAAGDTMQKKLAL